SANDVAFALEAFSHGSGSAATVIAPNVSRPLNRERIFWIAACALLAIVAAGSLVYKFLPSTGSAPQLRLALRTPPSITNASSVTISPNGQRVAFTATDAEGNRSLWARPLDSLEARRLEGTDEGFRVFWSPDSRHVGYFAGGKLYRIDTDGGRPQALCDVTTPDGGTWNRDGVILFGGFEGVYRVNASGGKPALITKVGEKEE